MKFAASGANNRTTDSPIPNLPEIPEINCASTFRTEQVHLKLDVLALGWDLAAASAA